VKGIEQYKLGRLTPEMEVVTVCELMHWTYLDYMSQPDWFLKLFMSKLSIDNERERKRMEKQSREFMRARRK